MADPVARVEWADNDPQYEKGVVWWSRLDGRYQVEVQSSEDPYRGVLAIFDHDDGDKLIHSEEVGVAYGAPFGPDADDVAIWQAKALAAVDSQ